MATGNKLQPETVMAGQSNVLDFIKSGVSEETLRTLFKVMAEQIQTSDPTLAKLRAYELEEVEKKRKLAEEKSQRDLQTRIETAHAMEAQRKGEEAYQAICSHMKPRNAGSAISGQRNHRGGLALICQQCGKRFSAIEEIPPSAIPDMNNIGGPIPGSM